MAIQYQIVTNFNKCLFIIVAPRSFMIYSQRNSVVRLLPDSSDYPEAILPIQGLNRIKAVDFDPISHYLYWVNFCIKI